MLNHDFELLIALSAFVVGIVFLWIARIDAR